MKQIADSGAVQRLIEECVLPGVELFHNRKNALFYRMPNGAQVGDLFMTLVHTCQVCGTDSFDYLTELQFSSSKVLSMARRPKPRFPSVTIRGT
jgi:hypothetical protein